MHRVGIVPFDVRDQAIALLFVTSQSRGRWILPKGVAKAGETHSETCHREGFEEAGIRGVVLTDFPTTVVIGKKTPDGLKQVPVTYYPFLVQEQVDEWPEKERRQRHWALIEDAAKVAYKEDYLPLIKHFDGLKSFIREAALSYK